MSYLKFDKTRMVNLEYSLSREILRTNRKGAYHCTTLVECNTRKQHGLLVMPVPELDDSNHVLLSSFDETVIQHGAEFNLGIHKYDGDNYSPQGHKYIREFDCESCPKTVYRVGGVILSKEKMFSLEDNAIYIRYTLLDAHSPTTLRFRPFLAFRNINNLTTENASANKDYKEVENGISVRLYTGYPNLYMQFNKEAKFIHDPNWYKGIEYKQDMEDGLPYKEDLYVPGYFELSIAKGESIVFSAGDKSVDTPNLIELFKTEIKRRTPRSSFYNCLKNSAHQFFYRPSKTELYLLAGYPWFGVSAREQFFSLPGLTLYLGKKDAFEEVMDTALPSIKQLLQNKEVTGRIKGMEEPDIPFYILWAVTKFYAVDKQTCIDKYGHLILDIITFIRENKHKSLHLLENKLLYIEANGKPIGWMNGVANGKPVVNRAGCLVEINALWYNSLMFGSELSETMGRNKMSEDLSSLATEVKQSFIDTFTNESGYLFDFVDGSYIDWSVRPNMLIALSLEYPLLDRRQSRRILDMITKELLTPKGLRSLSPKSSGYNPNYQGTQDQREYVAYNGGAWPWLLSPFVEAYLKIHKRAALSFIDRVLAGVEDEMSNHCIGSLSQVYDATPPYTGHGGLSYAPNVAGVIRVLMLMKSFEE